MFYIVGVLLCFVILALLVIPVYYFYYKPRRRKQFDSVFAGRLPLDEKEFHDRYFSSTDIPFFVTTKIRQILEEEIDADLSRLMPSDDFVETFSFFDNDDWYDTVEATMRFEEEFEIEISDKEGEAAKTFGLLSELIWKKVDKKPTA